MNFLRLADGVSGLLPKKIKIRLIHRITGIEIISCKVNEEWLPEVFDRLMVVEIDGETWRITDVKVLRENSYLFGRKVVLYVIEPQQFDFSGKFAVPTVPGSTPLTRLQQCKEGYHIINLNEWRQIEFINSSLIESLQIDLNDIEALLKLAPGGNKLCGYEHQVKRNILFDNSLDIRYDEFIKRVDGNLLGSVYLDQETEIENSFIISTEKGEYYGVCDDNKIRVLCVRKFECVDDGLVEMMTSYGMVIADWCNAKVFMETPEDAPEISVVKIM